MSFILSWFNRFNKVFDMEASFFDKTNLNLVEDCTSKAIAAAFQKIEVNKALGGGLLFDETTIRSSIKHTLHQRYDNDKRIFNMGLEEYIYTVDHHNLNSYNCICFFLSGCVDVRV